MAKGDYKPWKSYFNPSAADGDAYLLCLDLPFVQVTRAQEKAEDMLIE